MAEAGTYYITIMPEMSKFTSSVNKALGQAGTSGGKAYSKTFMDVLKGSAIGTALGNLASKAGSAIMDGLSTGINRLDTIKNFPRVMEALGYSADDAQEKIQLIMKRLDGLPTATQDVVSLTQAFADSTGDLDLATRAALGFNDMLLANGASAAEVAQASGVMNRVLGKGSATVAQWQSLTSVMPAQLAAVAKQMLGASASGEDLHAALEDGTVSWNDFLQAIVQLDESGYVDEAGNKIASFEEQARANSDGIGTAIDNIKNRIGAGWADILEAIGREDISGAINTMSYGVRDGMGRIADAIGYVKDRIAETSIGESLKTIFDGISGFFTDTGNQMLPVLKDIADRLVEFAEQGLQKLVDKGPQIKQFADDAKELVGGGLQWLLDHGDQLAGIMEALAAALAFKTARSGFGFLFGAFQDIQKIAVVAPLLDHFWELPQLFQYVADSGGPLSGVLDGLATSLNGVIKIGSGFMAPFAAIAAAIAVVVAAVIHLWRTNEDFRKSVTGMMDKVRDKLAEAGGKIAAAFEVVKPALDDVVAGIGVAWDFISQIIGANFLLLMGTVTGTITGIVDVVTGVVETIAGIIEAFQTGDWSMFTQGLLDIWNGIWELFTAPLTGVFDAIGMVVEAFGGDWDQLCSDLGEDWKGFTDVCAQEWESFQSFLAGLPAWWEGIKTAVMTKVAQIKKQIEDTVELIKQTVAFKVYTLKQDITTRVEEIKSSIVDKFNAAKDSALGTFESIKSGIVDKIQWVKDRVAEIIDGIKGLFDFDWQLPTPKLPHIEWHWEDVAGLFSFPVFDGVSWYAKGGIFDAATLIGIGEAGKEAALPLNQRTYSEMARGIVSEMANKGGDAITIEKLADTIIIREEADVDRIMERVNSLTRRERAAMA